MCSLARNRRGSSADYVPVVEAANSQDLGASVTRFHVLSRGCRRVQQAFLWRGSSMFIPNVSIDLNQGKGWSGGRYSVVVHCIFV